MLEVTGIIEYRSDTDTLGMYRYSIILVSALFTYLLIKYYITNIIHF